MSGAEAPQDLRCPCGKKFADATAIAIVIKCRGCDQPLEIPLTAFRTREALLRYLDGLPPRKPRFRGRRQK